MKDKIMKIVMICIAVIVNVFLIGMLVMSVNSYIYKIHTGDIQVADEESDEELNADLAEMIKSYFSNLTKSENLRMIIILVIALIIVIGGIYLFKIYKKKSKQKPMVKKQKK